MTDAIKPLPCPFCGNDLNIYMAMDSRIGTWFECLKCCASGPFAHKRPADESDQEFAEALRLWNQRASCEENKGGTG